MDPASTTLGEIEREVLDALRRAREPVREAFLYERLRASGIAIDAERFIAIAERLAVLGHLLMVPEHDLPSRDPPPFEPRYYHLIG